MAAGPLPGSGWLETAPRPRGGSPEFQRKIPGFAPPADEPWPSCMGKSNPYTTRFPRSRPAA